MLKTLMIVIMTMNHGTVVRFCQRLALILSSQREEELNHEVNLFFDIILSEQHRRKQKEILSPVGPDVAAF